MKEKMYKQARAIRRYAKSLNIDIEKAAALWCESGLAARWAEYNG